MVSRSPGFTVEEAVSPSDITVDVYFTPHLSKSRVLNERLAAIIQEFGEGVVIPSLHAFTTRCRRHSQISNIAAPCMSY